MAKYDEDGLSTDETDPDGVDPTHPNHAADPRFDSFRNAWRKAHPDPASE